MMTTKFLLMALVVGLLAGCATTGDLAAAKKDAAGFKGEVLEFTRVDLETGIAIAMENGDIAAQECGEALLAIMPDEGKVSIAVKGPFSTYVKARGLLRKVDAGPNDLVHRKCAVLVMDFEKRVVKLGVAILPGGGVVGKLLGK